MISMKSQLVAHTFKKMTVYNARPLTLRKSAFKKSRIGVYFVRWMFLSMDTLLCLVKESSLFITLSSRQVVLPLDVPQSMVGFKLNLGSR